MLRELLRKSHANFPQAWQYKRQNSLKLWHVCSTHRHRLFNENVVSLLNTAGSENWHEEQNSEGNKTVNTEVSQDSVKTDNETDFFTKVRLLRKKHRKNLFFDHLNINSLRNKRESLEPLIRNHFDIFLVSENVLDCVGHVGFVGHSRGSNSWSFLIIHCHWSFVCLELLGTLRSQNCPTILVRLWVLVTLSENPNIYNFLYAFLFLPYSNLFLFSFGILEFYPP